ncbi:hypothetical protein KDK_82470 [Dictyobacter kobayashii]|uniref:Uncharacterized protein n=1 Tax=Dictyobacter kobayashii TaxID=2014872 RepID=A0A402AZF1_9CHLR|nr:hypothetical protein KDK_82470 [Dictyobacter kobayashii]
MRAQLRNDMRDLHNPQKSDVRREKKTLPIFYSKSVHEDMGEKGLQSRLLYIDTALSALLSSLLQDLELSQQVKFIELRKMLGLSLPSNDEAN